MKEYEKAIEIFLEEQIIFPDIIDKTHKDLQDFSDDVKEDKKIINKLEY